ncbi:MAG: TadE/TadG family type IV pilus assembly protein [Pseudomonadota bacterium]|nr:TadE/TadG family type IV pilus assembly protein [Pseudomonadota bacterium]
MMRTFRRIVRFGADRNAIAATEFALFAPILTAALLLMSDIGLAITEQISLQQGVRAGAQFVMSGVTDTEDLKDLIRAATTGLSKSDQDDVNLGGAPLVDAVKSCRCASDGAEVACDSTCANDRPCYVFFDLSAEKTYEALFIPDIPLKAEIRVQTR